MKFIRWVDRYPWLPAVVGLLIAYALIGPWGDFPLNDDFTYARIVKRFADSGRIVLDLPVNSAVVGQALLVAPFIKAFGFSHLLVRMLTMSLGVALIWILDRLLVRGAVSPRLRMLTLALLALNPLYLYLSTTFLIEWYGHVPAFIGTLLWLRARAKADRIAPEGPIIGILPALLIAALIGSMFWTRQYCVIGFPALIGAALFRLAMDRQWPRVRQSLPALLASSTLFVMIVLSYFPWARRTGNFRPEFQGALHSMMAFKPLPLAFGFTNFVAYITVFFFPLLLLFRWRHLPRRRAAWISVTLVASELVGWAVLQRAASTQFGAAPTLHRVFPFAGNVIYNAGMGPATVTDVFFLNLERPQWPSAVWYTVSVLIVVAVGLWSAPLLQIQRLVRARRGTFELEFFFFILLFSLASLLVPLQVFKENMFDRYYLPAMIGVIFLLAQLLEFDLKNDHTTGSPVSGLGVATAVFAFSPVAIFGVFGLHDQFRWNEARWSLLDKATASGISPTNIDGGYEVNGWLTLDAVQNKVVPSGCIGACMCDRGWWCLDASYHIGMNVLAGYEPIASIAPAYWLTHGPSLYLLRRQQPMVRLSRYASPGGSYLMTTGAPPSPGSKADVEWHLLQTSANGTRPLMRCQESGRAFVGTEETCNGAEPLDVLGYVFKTGGRGARPIYACHSGLESVRFISAEPACEGGIRDGTLGYSAP